VKPLESRAGFLLGAGSYPDRITSQTWVAMVATPAGTRMGQRASERPGPSALAWPVRVSGICGMPVAAVPGAQSWGLGGDATIRSLQVAHFRSLTSGEASRGNLLPMALTRSMGENYRRGACRG